MSAGLAITRVVVSGAAIVLFALGSPSTAAAAPGGGGGQGSGAQTGGVLTAGVSYADSSGSGGGGDGCVWTRVDGDLTIENNGTATWPRTDESGRIFHLYEKRCGGEFAGLWEFPETDPASLLELALERLESSLIPEPVPVLTMLDPEFGWAYVRTPLDFRAGGESWRTVSVTARLGPVWATASAAPDALTFDSGDPNGPPPVTCAGDAPVAAYVAEAPGECSYTYVNASSTSPYDGYHFLATLTIDWVVAWTSSTGAGGVLPGYQSSATAEVAVAEAKGLVVCTGSRPEQGGC
jgi:hypothetical protein